MGERDEGFAAMGAEKLLAERGGHKGELARGAVGENMLWIMSIWIIIQPVQKICTPY